MRIVCTSWNTTQSICTHSYQVVRNSPRVTAIHTDVQQFYDEHTMFRCKYGMWWMRSSAWKITGNQPVERVKELGWERKSYKWKCNRQLREAIFKKNPLQTHSWFYEFATMKWVREGERETASHQFCYDGTICSFAMK